MAGERTIDDDRHAGEVGIGILSIPSVQESRRPAAGIRAGLSPLLFKTPEPSGRCRPPTRRQGPDMPLPDLPPPIGRVRIYTWDDNSGIWPCAA